MVQHHFHPNLMFYLDWIVLWLSICQNKHFTLNMPLLLRLYTSSRIASNNSTRWVSNRTPSVYLRVLRVILYIWHKWYSPYWLQKHNALHRFDRFPCYVLRKGQSASLVNWLWSFIHPCFKLWCKWLCLTEGAPHGKSHLLSWVPKPFYSCIITYGNYKTFIVACRSRVL